MAPVSLAVGIGFGSVYDGSPVNLTVDAGGGATPYCTGPGGRCVECLVAKDCPGTGRVVCADNRCL